MAKLVDTTNLAKVWEQTKKLTFFEQLYSCIMSAVSEHADNENTYYYIYPYAVYNPFMKKPVYPVAYGEGNSGTFGDRTKTGGIVIGYYYAGVGVTPAMNCTKNDFIQAFNLNHICLVTPD